MSWGDKWIDPRQSQEPLQAARLYPDLVRAGSLANELDQELARVGSLFGASPSFAGLHRSWSYAEVMSGDRTVGINCRAEKRKFRLDLSEDAISMARGTTRELSELAAAVELLLNSTDKVSDLVREIRFMKLEERALRYENGTYIEDRWQDFLADPFDRAGGEIFHWDDLAELIRQAADRPELRRLLPFTSLHRFSVTRRRQLPEKTIPMIWPLGDGQYSVARDSGPPFRSREVPPSSSMHSSNRFEVPLQGRQGNCDRGPGMSLPIATNTRLAPSGGCQSPLVGQS